MNEDDSGLLRIDNLKIFQVLDCYVTRSDPTEVVEHEDDDDAEQEPIEVSAVILERDKFNSGK